jgi:hypothetical protein
MSQRPLNFRAWDARRNKFLEDFNLTDCGSAFHINMFETVESLDVEIIQFTGIVDKKGVHIYEGDIVTDGSVVGDSGTQMRGIVEFENAAYRVTPINCTCGDCVGEILVHCTYEIIGNKFTHPQLLNQNS